MRPHNRPRPAIATFLLASAALWGCATPQIVPDETVPEVIVDLPPTFAQADSAAVYNPLRWWTAFDDPVLDRLVDSALVANLDLAEAVARVDETRARAGLSRASLWPGITASTSVTHSDSPSNTGQFAAFGTDLPSGIPTDTTGGGIPSSDESSDRISFTQTSLTLGVQYELDFWGRARNETRASVGDLYASAADLQAARLGVLAQTISTYFEIVDLRSRIELTVESLSLIDDRLAVTENRYERGLVGSFELYQLRQEFRGTQASLPQLERQLTDAEGRLAALVGVYAGQLGAMLPDSTRPRLVIDDVPAGLPSELLIQRPDVRAAAYRYEAARYRIGAARAQLFPSVSLGGSVGTQADGVLGLLDPAQWVASLTAGVTAPLFQGGRLRSNVEGAEAGYRRLGAAYARSVLTAFRETETALEAYEEERQRYTLLADQLSEAQASAQLQADRYRRGVGDVTDYLDALRAEVSVQTQLASAARSVALAQLDIHRALGGGWIEDGVVPDIRLVPGEVATPHALDGRDRPAVPVVGIPSIPDPLRSASGEPPEAVPTR